MTSRTRLLAAGSARMLVIEIKDSFQWMIMMYADQLLDKSLVRGATYEGYFGEAPSANDSRAGFEMRRIGMV